MIHKLFCTIVSSLILISSPARASASTCDDLLLEITRLRPVSAPILSVRRAGATLRFTNNIGGTSVGRGIALDRIGAVVDAFVLIGAPGDLISLTDGTGRTVVTTTITVDQAAGPAYEVLARDSELLGEIVSRVIARGGVSLTETADGGAVLRTVDPGLPARFFRQFASALIDK